jgi:hypothetical protein
MEASERASKRVLLESMDQARQPLALQNEYKASVRGSFLRGRNSVGARQRVGAGEPVRLKKNTSKYSL